MNKFLTTSFLNFYFSLVFRQGVTWLLLSLLFDSFYTLIAQLTVFTFVDHRFSLNVSVMVVTVYGVHFHDGNHNLVTESGFQNII